ncbi:MAG: hypothetical protein PHY28_02180 [Dehalococcoidales bacterium]|nr:hypothetical protein [Dehalococcoidales bacterium]
MFNKEFFESVLSKHVEVDSSLKITLDDGSSFNPQKLIPLGEVLLAKIQTEPEKPLISKFIPYERIRFAELIPVEKHVDIIDFLFNRKPEDCFRQVPIDVKIHPTLKYDDLNLLRKSLVELLKHGTERGGS